MSTALPADDRLWRPCPLCGTERSNAHLHLEKGGLRVVRCSNCGMLFANPVPREYLEGDFYEQLAQPFYLSPDKLDSDYAPVRYRRELRLFRRFCQGGSVLDVGCSTGAFLHQLQTQYPSQYQVLGIDVAGPALDHAERRGVPVLRAPFLEHDFGDQRFDGITFWAVLEHLGEPKRFFSKAASLLHPGGHCFILVPNMQSLAVRLLGKRYRYVMPEHLNYFTRETLEHFLREPQAQLVHLRSLHFNPLVIWQDFWDRPELAAPAARARLLRRTTQWKQNPLMAPVQPLYAIAESILAALNLADNLVAVLRKC